MKAARGLEARAPEKGRAADCWEVARTALYLYGAKHAHDAGFRHDAARHASELHRLSGALGAIDLRRCNGPDVTCPDCDGEGVVIVTYTAPTGMAKGSTVHGHPDCRACGGTGYTTGKRQARLRADAEQIAAHYGLRCYFQTDPRGCALYLIDPEQIPKMPSPELVRHMADSRDASLAAVERAQEGWIDSNYTQGHAVVRLGR